MESSQIVTTVVDNGQHLLLIVKLIVSAFVVSVGSFAAALAQGRIAEKACESLATANQTAENGIKSVFFYGLVFVETCALYCLILAMIFLFAL
jgi:F0F1-type ATP synthase membrane subunit c/vacuolar-type H+-ATPase subunit K